MTKIRNWSILKHGTERSVTKTRNKNALTKYRNGPGIMTKTRIKTTKKINIHKIATVHSLSLQFNREFLLDHIELLCETDACMTLEATLNAAVNFHSCRLCVNSTIGAEKIQCGGICLTLFHESCVKIDRRKKVWTCSDYA